MLWTSRRGSTNLRIAITTVQLPNGEENGDGWCILWAVKIDVCVFFNCFPHASAYLQMAVEVFMNGDNFQMAKRMVFALAFFDLLVVSDSSLLVFPDEMRAQHCFIPTWFNQPANGEEDGHAFWKEMMLEMMLKCCECVQRFVHHEVRGLKMCNWVDEMV